MTACEAQSRANELSIGGKLQASIHPPPPLNAYPWKGWRGDVGGLIIFKQTRRLPLMLKIALKDEYALASNMAHVILYTP